MFSTPLFNAYLMVDWSSNAKPNTGEDSIWFALAEWREDGLWRSKLKNLPTRYSALCELGDLLASLLKRNKRVLVGLDFPFGYPYGTAKALGLKNMPWRKTWKTLAETVQDDRKNRNNRFQVADQLNQKIAHPEGPFWGHPYQHKGRYRNLAPTKPAYEYGLAEKRICENLVPGPQPVWKLSGAGSVGSQTLTGLPVVNSLRKDSRLKEHSCIWPFETGLKTLGIEELKQHSIVFAEIYPSLVIPCSSSAQENEVKDAQQVQAIAAYMASLDERKQLGNLFSGDPSLNSNQQRSVEREEAWILGVTEKMSHSDMVKVDLNNAFVGMDQT